jgi:integrase/recombinase XerD
MLTSAIDRYLELRRALGYKLITEERMLRCFAGFAKACGDSHVVSETVLAWAARSTTARQRDKRTRVVIGFARFVHAEDPRHAIPPPPLPSAAHTRPLPHIFSPQEIVQLMTAAAHLPPEASLRPLTFSTLFGLLACTGLRISEALSLRLDDLRPDGLIIRETKFQKSRLLPLHATTTCALNRYLERRLCVVGKSDHLFVSLKGTPVCYETASRTFRHLCASAGLDGVPPVRRPRLHDLRHTVAVRALEACPHVRDDVTAHMLALSTYLGHCSARGTYWYLQSSPQLMQDVAGAAQDWLAGDAP